jgi:hypothetical protein
MGAADVATTVLSADRWWAVYDQGDDGVSRDPVVCWVVKQYRTGRVHIVGMVPADATAHRSASAKAIQEATKWSNFLRYERS